MSAKFQYHKIIKYLVTAVCTEPLHIGSAMGDKEEVLVHPVDNVPFIQATSIAGVFREYYKTVYKAEKTDNLFGSQNLKENDNASEYGSKVKFGDGIFQKGKVKLELRPRVKIDPVSGTGDFATVKGTNTASGQKFNMEYIGAGAKFSFPIYLYAEECQEELEDIFGAIQNENIVFGGQKSCGCGYIKIEQLKCKVFNMKEETDRSLWAMEEVLGEEEYEDKTAVLKPSNFTKNAYEIIVEGKTEGELLVKSIAVAGHGEEAPDVMNMQNAAGDYIIPGSSFKGAVRNQMEKIASYLHKQEIIENTFGRKGQKNKVGKVGNIRFFDTVVGEKEVNDSAAISNRVHIDKFTGGVMYGSLFSQKNVSGKLKFKITIQDINEPDRTCGMLLLTLRDLAIGTMSVGGGYNIGKGIIDVNKITVYSHKKGTAAVLNLKAEDSKEKIQDAEGIIEQCMHSIRGEE